MKRPTVVAGGVAFAALLSLAPKLPAAITIPFSSAGGGAKATFTLDLDNSKLTLNLENLQQSTSNSQMLSLLYFNLEGPGSGVTYSSAQSDDGIYAYDGGTWGLTALGPDIKDPPNGAGWEFKSIDTTSPPILDGVELTGFPAVNYGIGTVGTDFTDGFYGFGGTGDDDGDNSTPPPPAGAYSIFGGDEGSLPNNSGYSPLVKNSATFEWDLDSEWGTDESAITLSNVVFGFGTGPQTLLTTTTTLINVPEPSGALALGGLLAAGLLVRRRKN